MLLVAVSAYSGSIGYYGVLFCRALADNRQAPHASFATCTRCAVGATARRLVLDFGSAELLDSLLFSPLLLYVCITTITNIQCAVIVSEIASTIAFYATVLLFGILRACVGRRSAHTEVMLA